LTGAGVSTRSGVPDYTTSVPFRPIHQKDAERDERVTRLLWSRGFFGFSRFLSARPNPIHHLLSRSAVITQNVDGLHERAMEDKEVGSVVALHGSSHRVRCLSCGARDDRLVHHSEFALANPQLSGLEKWGPAEEERVISGSIEVAIPRCKACGTGVVIPDVVFFGGTVPAEATKRALEIVEGSEALIVLGSRLRWWSARRLVSRIKELNRPVIVITRGKTHLREGDAMEIDADLSDPQVMTFLQEQVEEGVRV
jgi:NAD-dependent SIR2 family protein deacetylase